MDHVIRISLLNATNGDQSKLKSEFDLAGIDCVLSVHENDHSLLSEFKSFNPDFVICFEKFISIDWIEALKNCKQFCPDAAFILINTSCSPEVTRSASRRRADHIIWGDFFFRIPAIIAREIELRRVKDELRSYQSGFVPEVMELENSITLAESVFDQMQAVVLIKDARTNLYTYSNPAAERILGLKKSFVCGRTSEQVFDRFKGSYYHNRDREQIEKGQEFATSDDLVHTLDGGVRVFTTKRLLLTDSNDKPDRIISISEDVTAAKKTLYELQKCSDKMNLLLRNMPIALLVVSESEMTAVNTNPLFAELLSVPPDEIIGKSVFDLFPEKTHNLIRNCIDDAIRNGSSEDLLLELDDQLPEKVLSMCIRYILVDPVESHFAFFIKDISSEKHSEVNTLNYLESERELSLMKSRFLSMVGHELRTPLTTIMISADIMKRYSSEMPPEDLAKHCERIQSTILTMINMIEKVMTIGKMDSNRFEFSPENIDLQAFCRSIIDDLEISRHAEHRIQFEFHGDSVYADVDETLLGLILNNLLSNALKYSPNGDEVRLGIICSLGELEITVEDHGIGIPPEDLPNLFETFYRANNVDEITGYGLGLSIVKKSVAAHNGTITVESHVGHGTKFIVSLPARNGEH